MTSLAERLGERPYHLALSAGWFGYVAHAALLFALDEAGVPPASLSGSSSGAVAAALYGAGLRGEELRELVITVRRDEILRFRPGLGLLTARPLEEKLRRITGGRRLEDLSPPIAISTCRLFGGRHVIERRGDLARAVHASLAVPGVFRPVRIEGQRRVDGGWRDPQGFAGASPTEGPILFHDLRETAVAVDAHPDLHVIRFGERRRFGPRSMEEAGPAFEESLAHARGCLRSAMIAP